MSVAEYKKTFSLYSGPRKGQNQELHQEHLKYLDRIRDDFKTSNLYHQPYSQNRNLSITDPGILALHKEAKEVEAQMKEMEKKIDALVKTLNSEVGQGETITDRNELLKYLPAGYRITSEDEDYSKITFRIAYKASQFPAIARVGPKESQSYGCLGNHLEGAAKLQYEEIEHAATAELEQRGFTCHLSLKKISATNIIFSFYCASGKY